MKKIVSALLVVLFSLMTSISVMAQTLHFGIIYFYPPFAFTSKSGYLNGFDVDLAKAVCQQLHTQCSFTPMPLQALFTSVAQGKVDAIIGALSISPHRQQYYDTTQPYYKSTMSYVALGRANINIDNLNGKRVGVEKGSIFKEYIVQKYGDSIKVVSFATNEELVTALSEKKVDIIALDTPAANYWVGYSTGLFSLVGSPVTLPDDHGYGIIVKKGNDQLLNNINNALTTLKTNGTLTTLQGSYFNK